MTEPLDLLSPRHDGPTYPYTGRQVEGILFVVIPTLIAVIMCALRVYSRTITRTFGTDDWLVCVATFFTINQCWASNLFIHDGYIGVHGIDIPPHGHNNTWLWNWLGQLFYMPIFALVKISVLVFLLRLGGEQKRGVRMAIYWLIAFNAVQLVAVELVTILECDPIHLAWTAAYFEREALGHCINLAAYTLTIGALNILTDFSVLILPFRIFLDLKINKRMRNALIGVFLLGLAIPALSAGRLYLFYRNFYVVMPDPTYSIAYVISAVESNLAITVASVPPLWPLARRWFPAMDEKLGINRNHQADIEVQLVGDSGETSTRSTSFPKVKVKWTRADTVRHSGQYLESPDLGSAAGRRADSAVGKSVSAEGGSRDGLMLPSSAFVSPLPSPMEKLGEEEQPDISETSAACDPPTYLTSATRTTT